MHGGADGGRDTIYGAAHQDTINGGLGHDFLHGGGGNDSVIGGGGHDIVVGGAGNDVLVGGRGNDTLFGNTGADTFVFETAWDADTVADWAPGVDEALIFSGYTAADVTLAQQGADVLFTLVPTGDTIIFQNALTADIDLANDFIFA